METSVKPQKRNTNLVPLSKEHHFGLLFGWKIKQGIANKTSLQTIREYVLYFWKNNLQQHFDIEEQLLGNVLPEPDLMLQQMLREHQEIREMVQQIESGNNLSESQFEALHVLLTNHIRFEERTLFPHLEQAANEKQLAIIGQVLHHDHEEPVDDFLPAFWEKSKPKTN